jgi:hypothetical protein
MDRLSVEVWVFEFGLVGEDKIPSIEAVFAAIGDEVAW